VKSIVVPLVCFLSSGPALAACDDEKPASVMVAITSEAPVPESIDLVEVSIRRDGVERFVNFYEAGSNLDLPGTLAIDKARGQDADDPISVTVTGWSRGAVLVERRATVLFVEGEQRVLRMPLRFACLGVPCAEGQTCKAGACLPAAVDLTQAPVYDDATVFGGENPVGCFSRSKCGDERTTWTADDLVALFDPADCTLQATAPQEARDDLNLGLVWTGDPRRGWTVVDRDTVEGWDFDPAYAQTGKVYLVPGLCEAVKAGKIEGGQRVLGCAPKLPDQPLCPDEDGALPLARSACHGRPCTSGGCSGRAAWGPSRRRRTSCAARPWR
jgi:hypothetical protein